MKSNSVAEIFGNLSNVSKVKFYSICYTVGVKCDLDRSTKHPKFDPTGVQTQDLQIMTVGLYFMTPALTTRPSVTSNRNVLQHYLRGLR